MHTFIRIDIACKLTMYYLSPWCWIDQIHNPTMHQDHNQRCASPIPHSAVFCSRNVQVCAHFVTKWGIFTNVSRALQDILSKFVYCRNRSSDGNFKLKLCTCAQSHALGTHTKFQREIPTVSVISDIMYFREFILELDDHKWRNKMRRLVHMSGHLTTRSSSHRVLTTKIDMLLIFDGFERY